ncbi:TetR/AcrR family transcriptional regulator [Geodermatophilus sp. SYSU D00815]
MDRLSGVAHDRSYGDPVPDHADDSAAPARPSRGARRREQLVQAGLDLLAERGWAGLTTRAVAERAGTHPGLVHYHFGGLLALKRAVAAAAVQEAFEPALAVLTTADSWPAGMATVVRAAAEHTDAATARLSAELIAASLQDAEIGDLMRQTLADARARLVPWLAGTGADRPEGLATLLVAALDGLLLHRLLDPALALEAVAEAADTLAGIAPRAGAVPRVSQGHRHPEQDGAR